MAAPPRCWDEWRARRLRSLEERALARSLRPVEPIVAEDDSATMMDDDACATDVGKGRASSASAAGGSSPVEVRVAPDTLARWLANDQDLGHSHEPSTSAAPSSAPSSPSSSSSRRLRLFSSNDYLGMSTHRDVRVAAARAALAHGSGPRSSALVCGYTPAHSRLERSLARLKGTEECVLFSSGYAANCGVIPALCDDRGCEIFSDELNHASIVDGCSLAAKRGGVKVTVYRHRDVTQLARMVRASRADRVMIVTDSLFSMDGDFAPLRDIVALKRGENARCGRARVLLCVDEAHATLVCGHRGSGAASMLLTGRVGREPSIADDVDHDMDDDVDVSVADVDVSVGTLSKAMGSHGGFVTCSAAMKRVLLSVARSAMFSTSLPAPIVAAATAALRMNESVGDEMRSRLRGAIATFATTCAARIRATQAARCVGMSDDAVNRWRGVRVTGNSPVVSVMIGSEGAALAAAAELLRRGFHVPAIRPPTVPANTCRLRVALSASHRLGDVRELAEAVADVVGGDGARATATAKL